VHFTDSYVVSVHLSIPFDTVTRLVMELLHMVVCVSRGEIYAFVVTCWWFIAQVLLFITFTVLRYMSFLLPAEEFNQRNLCLI